MNRLERFSTPLDQIVWAALESFRSGLWTALPGIVQTFDPTVMTCTVQPAIKGRFQNKDGSWQDWHLLPILQDVPVVFQGGGGFTLTFPVKAGDECLVVFSSRCIDNWWYLGEVQIPAEIRFNDLSDGFAIVGLRSLPRALSPAVDVANAELRSDDGSVKIQCTPTKVVVNAPAVELGNGGAIRKLVDERLEALFNGHTHPVGAGNTGAPNQQMGAGHMTTVTKAE